MSSKKIVKIHFDLIEWCPVIILNDHGSDEGKVPADVLDRYKKAYVAFVKASDALEDCLSEHP